MIRFFGRKYGLYWNKNNLLESYVETATQVEVLMNEGDSDGIKWEKGQKRRIG